MKEEDCDHLSWECSGKGTDPSGWGPWHKCTDCYMNWGTRSAFGKNNQVGACAVCGEGGKASTQYTTKDSGERQEYDSGMVRDTESGKPRYDLLLPRGVPYESQFITRVAGLLARGAEKYEDRNWEKASGQAELDRFKGSAFRHLVQWMTGEDDEDHGSAVVFNILAYESIKWKLDNEA